MHRKVSPAPCVLTVQVGEGPEPKGEAASFSSSPAPSRHLQDLARAWGISPVVSAPPPGEVYPSHDLGRERSEKPWLQHEKAVNFFTNSHFTPRFVHSCSAFNLQKKNHCQQGLWTLFLASSRPKSSVACLSGSFVRSVANTSSSQMILWKPWSFCARWRMLTLDYIR